VLSRAYGRCAATSPPERPQWALQGGGGYGAERETVTALTGGHRRPLPSAFTCVISGGFHALRA